MPVVTESRGKRHHHGEFRRRFLQRVLDADLTFEELETRLKKDGVPISRRTLQRYANGETEPLIGTKDGNARVKALARALKAPADWLSVVETEEPPDARAEDQ